MPFIGRLVDVGLARESSRGVGVAPTFWIPKTSFTHDAKVMKVRSQLSWGRIEGFGNQSLVAQRWAEGDFEGEILANSFGLILYALFGSVSTSGPTDSRYTHAFSVAQSNQHTSLSIGVEDDIGDLLFELAMLNTLEIKLVPDDVVRFTAGFMSKSPADATLTPAYTTTEYKFLGRDLTFKVAANTGALGAASAVSLKSLTLRFAKNLVRDTVLGTVDPEDIFNKQMTIEGEFALLYETDRTYRDLMLDGTYQAMRIDLTNTRDTIGASARPQFTLDLSRVDFDAWEREEPNDDIAMQTIQFHALYDQTNANVVNACSLYNTTVSY